MTERKLIVTYLSSDTVQDVAMFNTNCVLADKKQGVTKKRR
jgi:hypothetical protein